jgi:peptidoglycan-associated lipoprotein
MRLTFAVLALGVLGLLAGCPDKKPKGPGCAGDKDCKAGEHCTANQCVADGRCETNADCPGGECKAGRCAEATTAACTKDEDCADDEDCVDGRCAKAGRDDRPGACALEPVYFGFDARAIDEAGKTALGKDAGCLGQDVGRGVLLVGHTDPRGTEEYNIALSEDRAQVVGDYLSRLGVDPARFHVVPKGETEAVGTDDAGWTQDRKVELEWQ